MSSAFGNLNSVVHLSLIIDLVSQINGFEHVKKSNLIKHTSHNKSKTIKIKNKILYLTIYLIIFHKCKYKSLLFNF